MEIRIETQGLSPREVLELVAVANAAEGVESAKFSPDLPGTPQHRMLPAIQAGAGALHLIVKLASEAAAGATFAGGHHLYKKIGEGVVDKVWDAVKAKLTGESVVEVEVKLYGPDGELIKLHKGKR